MHIRLHIFQLECFFAMYTCVRCGDQSYNRKDLCEVQEYWPC